MKPLPPWQSSNRPSSEYSYNTLDDRSTTSYGVEPMTPDDVHVYSQPPPPPPLHHRQPSARTSSIQQQHNHRLSTDGAPSFDGSKAWRISILSNLTPVRSNIASKANAGLVSHTNFSKQDEEDRDPEVQFNMKLVVKKEVKGSERTSDYRGQYRRWPGVLLLLLLIGAAGFCITYGAHKTYEAKLLRQSRVQRNARQKRTIKDGKEEITDDKEIISDDGQIGNPKSYNISAIRRCAMPDYQSKNGKLYAVAPNGTEVPFQIKGLNWFGMEKESAVPFGLWENAENGTTAYEIAAFMARNKFNAVRLPVSIENVLNNQPPKQGMINKQTNRAISLKNFISALQSIVLALAYRQIGVMISLHTLKNDKPGKNWFDPELGVTQDDFLQAVDIISKNLCGSPYWNIMGLDLKNEPEEATWGTNDDSDFVIGAQRIAQVMHTNCPQWLGFVEGVVGDHVVEIDGKSIGYHDWWGGGLQKAAHIKPTFTIPNKLVWAPHYYTTAVSPQPYFYGDSTSADFSTYEELPDEALKKRVEGTMQHMFGYLQEQQEYALVLGEFAGLYTKDAHPQLTTKRTTDYTVQVMMEHGYQGGFMWCINPESRYEYNPANQKGVFTEGLLADDWLHPNSEFINAFAPMDQLPDLKPFPCFLEDTPPAS